VSSDQIAALGAFLSGVASVITARWAIRRVRRDEQERCEQRLKDVHDALREGFDMGHDQAD